MIRVYDENKRDWHTSSKEVFCDFVQQHISKGSFRIIYQADHLEIWCFGIEPRYRGHKYGQQMLSELIERFCDLPLELKCYKNNLRALHIYHKFGFQIVKDCNDYYWMRREVK